VDAAETIPWPLQARWAAFHPSTEEHHVTSYRVKVRPTTTYLWGNAAIGQSPSSPLFLTLRVDEIGDPITFGTVDLQPPRTPMPVGTLNPGEVYTVPLTSLVAVYATPANHTWVTCVVELLR